MRLGISNAYVFAGTGSPDVNNDGVFDGADDLTQSSAIGVAITDVSLGMVLMKEAVATAGKRSFTAFKASGTAQLIGVDGITLKGSLTSRSTPRPTDRRRADAWPRPSTSRSWRAAS